MRIQLVRHEEDYNQFQFKISQHSFKKFPAVFYIMFAYESNDTSFCCGVQEGTVYYDSMWKYGSSFGENSEENKKEFVYHTLKDLPRKLYTALLKRIGKAVYKRIKNDSAMVFFTDTVGYSTNHRNNHLVRDVCRAMGWHEVPIKGYNAPHKSVIAMWVVRTARKPHKKSCD